MDSYSYLNSTSAENIEDLYEQFLKEPNSIDPSWRQFFEGFDFSRKTYSNGKESKLNLNKELNALDLINAYRTRGHLFTKTNPVRERRKYNPTLDYTNFGFQASDLKTVFQAGNEIGIGPASLEKIISTLEQTYCQSIGAEYRYIRNPLERQWLESRMEGDKNTPSFSIDSKKQILNKLNQAVAFENFLHTKFPGQKRFSLEGAETLIPALDSVIEYGAELGIKEFVLGMAHRGRLNVLANILNKTYEDIFNEFEGKEYEENIFDGDVKYHLGFSSDIKTEKGKKVHLSVTPNPSHLEAVDPIVQGIVRSKIDLTPGGSEKMIAPILIHGDAAIAGQGIVYEVLQMSLLKGYKTGGTIHIVINNQIGFTTNYMDARSSTYCTDVAKVTLSPVFHVNGDDVEALVHIIRLAMEYRQTFHRDVFIDLLCYRKYGHNEGDEPRFTQPVLYKAIANHPNPREIYHQKLVAQGEVEKALADEMAKEFKNLLEVSLGKAKANTKTKFKRYLEGSWSGIRVSSSSDFDESPDTSISKEMFDKVSKVNSQLPANKTFFKKIIKLFNDRAEMLKGKGKLDWAMAELMAYGSLLMEGHPVRISGQDVERGTFSHRHAVVKLDESEEQYVPLRSLAKEEAPFFIFNSLLSEYGVLGFEYGYAFSSPQSLVVWEAQFGDFFNGAQIIFDQYLSSSEDKWRRMNGIVVILPHGFEGQGAEHSSARLERFLCLCAEDNIQIINCTTPANFFHAIRRQLKREFRKPLIVFTPKSLLRHPKCISQKSEFTQSKFKEVIDDPNARSKQTETLFFCSGKIYYDILDLSERESIPLEDVAIVRIEQLYPFPHKQIDAILSKYKQVKKVYWVQEEPENMGAWSYLLRMRRDIEWNLISRAESASPATGSYKQHEKEQIKIIQQLTNIQLVKS